MKAAVIGSRRSGFTVVEMKSFIIDLSLKGLERVHCTAELLAKYRRPSTVGVSSPLVLFWVLSSVFLQFARVGSSSVAELKRLRHRICPPGAYRGAEVDGCGSRVSDGSIFVGSDLWCASSNRRLAVHFADGCLRTRQTSFLPPHNKWPMCTVSGWTRTEGSSGLGALTVPPKHNG